MTLRTEFEPKLLAPLGFCNDAEACAEAWIGREENHLQDQIDRSKQWLQLCGTVKPVYRKQSSYGIKHEAERYSRMPVSWTRLLQENLWRPVEIEKSDD